jgi:hypothetical protein
MRRARRGHALSRRYGHAKVRLKDLKEHQNITDDQAREIFSPEVFRRGGGWAVLDGVEIYGHEGSHADGTRGWKVHSFGGLR